MIAEFIDINVVKFQDKNLRRVTKVTRRIALAFIFSGFYFLLFEVSRT